MVADILAGAPNHVTRLAFFNLISTLTLALSLWWGMVTTRTCLDFFCLASISRALLSRSNMHRFHDSILLLGTVRIKSRLKAE